MDTFGKMIGTFAIVGLVVGAGGCTVHEPDPFNDVFGDSVSSALAGQRLNPDSDTRVALAEERDGTTAVKVVEKDQISFEPDADVQPQALFSFGE